MPLLDCGHDGDGDGPRVCQHLLADRGQAYYRRFSGAGAASDFVCERCQTAPTLRSACAGCLREVERSGGQAGFCGQPEIATRASGLRVRRRSVTFSPSELGLASDIIDAQPLEGEDRQRWLAWTAEGNLVRLDLDEVSADRVPSGPMPDGLDALRVSPDGRFAVIYSNRGRFGMVADLRGGRTTMTLDRGSYFSSECGFPVAFCVHDGRLVLVHGTDWNRLDVSDPSTGERLTERVSPEHGGEHYLDYFHCGLSPSPDYEHLAEDGWVWSPVGLTVAWSLRRWLDGNGYESEDGESRKELTFRENFWGGPLCWLDGRRLAVWGLGEAERHLVGAVRIFDVTTGREERRFVGPERGELFFDEHLICCGQDGGLSVWDVETGERLLDDRSAPRYTRYHRSARSLLAIDPERGQFHVGKIVGHPVDPSWLTANVLRVAQGIAKERTFGDLPILGDALEDAGCSDADVLGHCRDGSPHGRECWVLDRILGS
jgi:hypothetical protein